MTDDQLRAIIREAIARHLAAAGPIRPGGLPPPSDLTRLPQGAMPVPDALDPLFSSAGHLPASSSNAVVSAPGSGTIASAPGGIAVAAAPGSVVHLHVSHATFALPAALDGAFDGPCRTEPHAGCTNCGFCQSLGY